MHLISSADWSESGAADLSYKNVQMFQILSHRVRYGISCIHDEEIENSKLYFLDMKIMSGMAVIRRTRCLPYHHYS